MLFIALFSNIYHGEHIYNNYLVLKFIPTIKTNKYLHMIEVWLTIQLKFIPTIKTIYFSFDLRCESVTYDVINCVLFELIKYNTLLSINVYDWSSLIMINIKETAVWLIDEVIVLKKLCILSRMICQHSLGLISIYNQ